MGRSRDHMDLQLPIQSVPITTNFKPCSWRGVLNTTLCYKVCQWLMAGLWFSSCTPISSTNKTDCHDITKILLKVALNTINQPTNQSNMLLHIDSIILTTSNNSKLELLWLSKYIMACFNLSICKRYLSKPQDDGLK